MLPVFAAIVSRTTVSRTTVPFVDVPKMASEKGTNVSRATSFVMNMLVKKLRRISTAHSILDL